MSTSTSLPIPAIGGFSGSFVIAANNAPPGATVTLTSYRTVPTSAPAPQMRVERRTFGAAPNPFASGANAIFAVSQVYSTSITFNGFPSTTWQIPKRDEGVPLALETIDGTTGTLLDTEFEPVVNGDVVTFSPSTATMNVVPDHTYWWELVAGKPLPPPEFVYVANGNDNTVSSFVKDESTGALTPIPGLLPTQDCPFVIAVHPSNRFIYVANNIQGVPQPPGSVSAFSVDPSSGALTEIAGSPFPAGTGTLGLAIDPSGRFAYTANFSSKDVSAYTIDQTTGALTPIVGSPYTADGGANSAAVDPSGRFLYVVNFDANTISAYSIDQSTGALTTVGAVATGNAPRLAAVDPMDQYVYVPNSGDARITMYGIDQTTGALTPRDTTFTGDDPDGVAADPSGRFVYVADVGSNSVSMYTVDRVNNALNLVASYPAQGQPTVLGVDPDGKFLYVTNSISNTIEVFSINQTSGVPTPLNSYATGQLPFGIGVVGQQSAAGARANTRYRPALFRAPAQALHG